MVVFTRTHARRTRAPFGLAVPQEVAPECVLAVAENAQFWPEVLAAKAAIDRGEIGQVLSARAKAWESATGEWAGDYAEGSWRFGCSILPSSSTSSSSAAAAAASPPPPSSLSLSRACRHTHVRALFNPHPHPIRSAHRAPAPS